MSEQSIAADLGEQFRTLYGFTLFDATQFGAAPFAAVPVGKSIESLKKILDEYRALPDRRRGSSQIRDVDSFLAIVDRFKSDASIVFADPNRSGPSVTAIFDYSPKGPDATKADWARHRAVYAPQLSDEWKAWMANNNKWLSQMDFAAHIEERVTELCVPNLDDPKLKTLAGLIDGVWASPGDMVALSRGLQVNVNSTVKSATVLNTGEVSIIYNEQHTDGAGQPLKIATLFRVLIPVFYAGVPYYLSARIRYRVTGAGIQWLYQIIRPDLAFDDAFNGKPDGTSGDARLSIVEKVRKETLLPVLLGSPEG